jgi:hypothetical protein
MQTAALSISALAVLRLRAKGLRVPVTAELLGAYRELAEAGIMKPVSTWTGGPESVFRFTPLGWQRREQFINGSADARRP